MPELFHSASRPAALSAPELWPAASVDAWQAAPMTTFADWLASQPVAGSRQFRETSRETYTAMFSAWENFLSSRQLTVLEACRQDAGDFFAVHRLEPVSRRRYLQLLDRVYRHLRGIGWPGANPFREELAQERVLPVAPPRVLSAAEQRRLAEVLARQPGWKGERDRALAALLLGAGLRTNEVVALRLSAVSADFRIRVLPAGVHRDHTTLILPDPPWRAWYREWEAERQTRGLPGECACPSILAGKPYSPSGLFRRISHWLAQAEVDAGQQGANILRNTFARRALTSGRYTPEQVQEFLGHEDVHTTLRHAGPG